MSQQLINYSLIALVSSLAGCNSGNAASNPTPSPAPSYCQSNVANFSAVAVLNLAAPWNIDAEWGPSLANLPFPANLDPCQESLGWQQQRVIAAASFWVSQQVNYCHHHVPTWQANTLSSISACESSLNVMPGSATYNQLSRWNYTGSASQTSADWYSYDAQLGYGSGNYVFGLDCSDYSKLNYAYAESINFTSAIALQAGQESSESALGPNDPHFVDATTADDSGYYSAGQLVCADGSVAPPRGSDNSSSCNGHGGYISVFGSQSQYVPGAISDTMLNNLQPGDLLYIAGCGSNNHSQSSAKCNDNPQQLVTHVVMWTGQKIGLSTSISNTLIAPETDTDIYGISQHQCGTTDNPNFWLPANNSESWIITDSHYQGPDFRVFTNCFYRNQLWGVRRVLL